MDDVTYVRNKLSHPGKPLYVHINGVYNRASLIWDSPVVLLASKGHDLGKLNIYFQMKLLEKSCEGLYTNHAYLSYLTLLSYLLEKKLTGVFTSMKDFLMVSICVLKHHGSLQNLDQIVTIDEQKRLFDFVKTGTKFPVHELMKLTSFDNNATPINLLLGANDKAFRSIFINKPRLNKFIPTRYDRLNFFLETRMCFSAVVYADKGDAGNQDMTAIKKKQSKKPYTPLNAIRTEMREVAVKNLRGAIVKYPDQRIFLVTYPTGAGKTVTMLCIGGVLYELTGCERIIYSIPFLSITEQIFDIIEKEIFSEDIDIIKRIDSKASPREDYDFEGVDKSFLRKTISFLRKVIKGKNLKEKTIETLLREDYMESAFDYSLIVTTFVKLFQGFTTASNRGLMKFSHLKGSILLIDEFQALPPSMYTFFMAMIDAFCKKFGSYAVISTATMPYLEIPEADTKAQEMFQGYVPPVEIGDHKYFSHPIFNRYEIRVLNEMYTRLSICQELSKATVPTLAVFNTVKDSREVYKFLKSSVDCPVYLMNSNFHPFDRRKILNKVKGHIDKHERVIMVSTQLIEAGVDIDFEVVYRDVAPIPNIIQTSGRCNREGKLNRGIIYLFRLFNDDLDKLRARTIYNGNYDIPFLDYALTFFFNNPNKQAVFEEKDLFTVQTNFFKFVSHNFRLGVWEKDGKLVSMVNQINDFLYGDIGQFVLIPKSRYGVQEQFYVPEGPNDDNYEKLHEYMAELAMLDGSDDPDRLRKSLSFRKRIHDHTKLMRDRVIQANLPQDAVISEYTEDAYESMICHIYKLRPGLYDSEFGLTIL